MNEMDRHPFRLSPPNTRRLADLISPARRKAIGLARLELQPRVLPTLIGCNRDVRGAVERFAGREVNHRAIEIVAVGQVAGEHLELFDKPRSVTRELFSKPFVEIRIARQSPKPSEPLSIA